jgi:hypothetical protein
VVGVCKTATISVSSAHLEHLLRSVTLCKVAKLSLPGVPCLVLPVTKSATVAASPREPKRLTGHYLTWSSRSTTRSVLRTVAVPALGPTGISSSMSFPAAWQYQFAFIPAEFTSHGVLPSRTEIISQVTASQSRVLLAILHLTNVAKTVPPILALYPWMSLCVIITSDLVLKSSLSVPLPTAMESLHAWLKPLPRALKSSITTSPTIPDSALLERLKHLAASTGVHTKASTSPASSGMVVMELAGVTRNYRTPLV